MSISEDGESLYKKYTCVLFIFLPLIDNNHFVCSPCLLALFDDTSSFDGLSLICQKQTIETSLKPVVRHAKKRGQLKAAADPKLRIETNFSNTTFDL